MEKPIRKLEDYLKETLGIAAKNVVDRVAARVTARVAARVTARVVGNESIRSP